jgi:two-component system, chemotaxis family, protein-glutamate methylesterase/glutaminase
MAYELVVIGASAGGLQAVGRVLAALPQSFALPIAVAQHRSSSPHEGNLVAMWQRETALTVREAEDKASIVPGSVYLAPADYHLLVETRGRFALSTEAPVLCARPSIDVLFETASDAYGAGVIGVILSGASRDGSQGLEAIRRRGGCALVQAPATAECDVMPSAAIAATAVNHVLELAELGRVLAALAGPFAGAR